MHEKSHHNSTLVKRQYHRFTWSRILRLAMAADVLRQKGHIEKAVGIMTKCVKCILDAENRKARIERKKHVTGFRD